MRKGNFLSSHLLSKSLKAMPIIIQKIFISSTDYDMPDISPEITRFIQEDFGLEVVSFKSQEFDVKKGFHSHDVCIDNIKGCDIFLLIIGSRYGGIYSGEKYPQHRTFNGIQMSVTWAEAAFAYENNIPIHVFVRNPILEEMPIYKKTIQEKKEHSAFHVEDTRVFEFIDYVVKNPQKRDNWIDSFDNVVDLKETLARRLEKCTDVIATIPQKYLATIERRANQNTYLSPQGEYIAPSLLLRERERPNKETSAPLPEDGSKETETDRIITLQELVTSNYTRVAIVANSGWGKTTLLGELVLKISRGEIKTPLIPIDFHFRQLLNASHVTVLIKNKFIGVKSNPTSLDKCINDTFNKNQFLFLVDGLDQLKEGNDPEFLLKGGDILEIIKLFLHPVHMLTMH